MGKFNLDWELNLSQLIYIFVVSFTWLGFSIWGGIALNSFYVDLPQYVQLFITLSRVLGGIGIGIGICLILYIILEQ
jgi:hypothetical protein